jgi:type I restriction enzyme R subunit
MNRMPFQPFNSRAPMTFYRRNLPHWQQEGCTYFVTFRLADSIPRQIVLAWEAERKNWLAAHGIMGDLHGAKFSERYLAINERDRRAFERRQAHQLLLELDRSHGSCMLEHSALQEALKSALSHFHGARYWSGDWVIMPNHVHWLVAPLSGYKLEDVLQAIKGFVSVQASGLGLKAGRLWQAESYDRIVRNREELMRIRTYIAQNPAQAGLAAGRFAMYRAEWAEWAEGV